MKLNISVLLLSAILALSACGKVAQHSRETAVATAPSPAPMAEAKMAAVEAEGVSDMAESAPAPAEPSGAADANMRKYIALRHHLIVESDIKGLEAAYKATLTQCQQLGCQLLSANFSKKTETNDPQGYIAARVPPKNVDALISGLSGKGEVIQHNQDSEDKTDQVVDVEARLKNLTALRDRLTTLLNNHDGKLNDILQVEREIANTQSEMDSLSTQRKILAQETDLVAVDITFQPKRTFTQGAASSPIMEALRDAGRVFSESIATIITFVAAILPWFVVIIPGFFLLRRVWRWMKAKFFKAK